MFKAKIAQVLPYTNKVWYRLSFGGGVRAEIGGKRVHIGYKHPPQDLRVRSVNINSFLTKYELSQDFVSDAGIDPAHAPLLFSNPFVLLDTYPCPQETDVFLRRMYKRVDNAGVRTKSTLDEIREFIFFSNHADEKYYAVSLLVKKLKAQAIPERLIPEVVNVFKASVLAARAESDVPMLAFLNGYLLSLENFIPLEEIDEMLPGIATLRICNSTKHLLKI